jgi:hypothetical protein
MKDQSEKHIAITGRQRLVARVAALALAGAGMTGIGIGIAGPAAASGCTTPPCGAVVNHSNTYINTKWSTDYGWQTGWVNAGGTMGGYYNDGLDIDFWAPPAGCRGRVGGSWYDDSWHKLSSWETVTVEEVSC